MAGIVSMKDSTRLYLGTSSTLVLGDKIGHVSQIGDVSSETEDVDVTTLESQAREFENGFTSNGELQITLNLTDNEYTKFKNWKDNGTDLYFGIGIFDKVGAQKLGLRGQGQIKSISLTGMSVGGLIQVNANLRLSGELSADFVAPDNTGVKKVTGITLAGAGSETSVDVGETLEIVKTIAPVDATNQDVTWAVNDKSKATIDANGVLTGVAAGTVVVIAMAKDGSGVAGSVSITVSGI